MIRISLTWFHLDVGMKANVQIYDTQKNEFLAEWNVEIEDPAGNSMRSFPQEPERHLPKLFQTYKLEVENLIRAYLSGYRHDTNVYQWTSTTPPEEESGLTAQQLEQIYMNHAH